MRISRRDMLTGGVSALTAAAASRALAAWEPSDRYPDPAIQILDPSFAKYRLNNAGIERLAVGMRWAEGPVWFGDGRYLLWSDAALDRITRWDEETGQVSIFRKPANKPNGLARPPGPAAHLRARRAKGHAHGVRRNGHGADRQVRR